MGHKTFEKGIHPSYYKEMTASRSVVAAAHPKTVIIPLSQHAGAPCEPLVKRGDVVEEGQKIGDVKAFISAPVHASISGKVKEVAPHPHPVGVRVLSVVITGDNEQKDWGSPNCPDISALDSSVVREAVREAGIVGMGGAGFPTSVKLNPPKGKDIDTVVLNGCECEPFLTADHRTMLEDPEKVVWGLKALMKVTGASAGIIGIEENKPDAIEAIERAAASDAAVKVVVLAAKYPQGAEKMLLQAALGRKIPLGKLPLDVGVVVNNVGTAVAVYEALCLGKPLIERVVTVSGNGVNEPGNMRVRIGTSFEEVLAQCGGVTVGAEMEVLNGGPMMGISQANTAVPVIKGTSGITVLTSRQIKPLEYTACIKCASCIEVCPMGLMPYRLGDYGRLARLAEFAQWDGASCIECGCCSYVCPAKRPLLHWIRVAKLRAREAARAAGA